MLDAGRIVEDGTPGELLARTGRFAHMWRTYTADAAAVANTTPVARTH